jgi:CubicO group peptidase (beta-lactamase class C family)
MRGSAVLRKAVRMGGANLLLTTILCISGTGAAAEKAETAYFPPPERRGGWRSVTDADEIRRFAGMDAEKLGEAWEYIKGLDDNSSLLVVRHGWLCYEKYQGAVTPTSNRDMHSCGKTFTGAGIAILMREKPELFARKLDQLVYSPTYLPEEAFPLTDPRKAEITLGQLLSHTSGIRGNNPSYGPSGKVMIDPAGPDGGFPENVAFGKAEWSGTSAETLWTSPGGGYSYASGGVVILGAIIRKLTGKEVAEYMREKVFDPIGWERWKWYGNPPEPDGVRHTKCQGGIQPRPRDALRFGYLLLHKGEWEGAELIPRWYVEMMRERSPYNSYYPGYGLLTVISPKGKTMPSAPAGTFAVSGASNNHIFVVPSLDLVVVRIGDRGGTQETFGVVQDKIIGAVIEAVDSKASP